MMNGSVPLRALLLVWLGGAVLHSAAASPIPVGVARVDVTPEEPLLLAGYGGRTAPFEGIDTRLWARALVVGKESPVAIVVLDNCGVPEEVTRRVKQRLSRRGFRPEQVVIAVTHTHNAPNLEGYAPIVWAGRTTPEHDRKTKAYTGQVVEKMEEAVVKALEAREPMSLEWAKGKVGFGGNRRVLKNGRWAGFGFQRSGPVDHSLPVLAALDEAGQVKAVWANYACHCTCVGSRNHVGGDWAGFANDSMEKTFPHAVSLVTIGCGADVGPQPEGSPALANQHGRQIGKEVQRLLSGPTTSLREEPVAVQRRIGLPLEKPAGANHWKKQLNEAEGFERERARSMLKRIETDGKLQSEVGYPLAAWTFGQDLAMVFLAGEVVVDYAVRLNRELDWSRLWVTAWANAMPATFPRNASSPRVATKRIFPRFITITRVDTVRKSKTAWSERSLIWWANRLPPGPGRNRPHFIECRREKRGSLISWTKVSPGPLSKSNGGGPWLRRPGRRLTGWLERAGKKPSGRILPGIRSSVCLSVRKRLGPSWPGKRWMSTGRPNR
ncbi:MAG: neutral/alkaline non-lysosomal ceramidase N-terminal domain-containing protein [Verrucomicrobiota bacterium]